MPKGRRFITVYGKNVFIAVCAAVALVGYLAFAPWMSAPGRGTAPQASPAAASGTGEITAPAGFQPPAGFEAPAGFTPPASTAPTAGSTGMPSVQAGPQGMPIGIIEMLPLIVPLAGLVGLVLALLSAWRPRFNRLATNLTCFVGVLALVYYAAFFAFDAVVPITLTSLVNAGFWVGLVGSAGLFVQVFIPRPRTEDVGSPHIARIVPQSRRSGMSVMQNLGVAVDALLANKMRSGLTMLGIIIGVAAVVSLLSVGQGAQNAVTAQISSTGLNLLTISPGARTGLGAGPGQGNGGGGGGSNVETLTYEDAQAIQSGIQGITAVLAQYTGSLKVTSDEDNLQTTILGTVEQYAATRNIDVEIGRYLSVTDRETNARVAVLGQKAAEELFGGLNPVGRTIRINSKQFEVVGVLAQQDSGFGNDPNLQIHVPITTSYRQLFDARQTGSSNYKVSSIVVSVADLDRVDAVSAEITTLLRDRHRLKVDDDDDFSILDQQTLLNTASAITGILTVLLGAIASVSLMVGGIGIMNIMLVSVTERTREIGLRKAIGARRSHILQQFLIETVFLSILGGALGVALGVGIALLVNASGLLTASISVTSIALGLGFSALVGIFFGVYPANQAAALEPIEALRYE